MITNPDGYLKTCDPQELKRECQCIQMAETNRMLRQELQELDPDKLVEENERLTRRVEALEKVLKPFQAAYEKLSGLPPSPDVIVALYHADKEITDDSVEGLSISYEDKSEWDGEEWASDFRIYESVDFTKIARLAWDQLKAVVKI